MTTWIVLRAGGVGAFLMLFGAVSWGLISTTSLISTRIAKATSILIHQVLGSVGLALLAIHIGGVLVDRFVRFGLLDVLVPLHSHALNVAVSFGVMAMYATVVVLVTSWARKGVGPTLWRRAHLLAAPAFTLAVVHGMLAGTDTTRPWMWWTYIATGLIVVFLLIVRGLTRGARSATRRPARRDGEPSRQPVGSASAS